MNTQRHCGWRIEGVGGGPHPQLPSAIVVQICPCPGQKSSLQANRGFPGPPQWWSTHVQRPPSAPGANSQKGNSKGHGPPHIAVPALGSPLTTPQPNGVGVGVEAAAGSQAQLPSACIVHVCTWSGQKLPPQATPAVPHSWSTQVQRPPAVPATNSQKGTSSGHGPPHVAVPALGSPLNTPHSTGVGVGVAVAATHAPAALHVSPAGQQIPPHKPVLFPSGPQTWQGPEPCAA